MPGVLMYHQSPGGLVEIEARRSGHMDWKRMKDDGGKLNSIIANDLPTDPVTSHSTLASLCISAVAAPGSYSHDARQGRRRSGLRMNQRREGGIGAIITAILIIAACAWGYSSLFRSDKWSLMYVNQAGGTSVAGNYSSRGECSDKLQVARQNPRMNHPECGSNCEPSGEIPPSYICEETFEL